MVTVEWTGISGKAYIYSVNALPVKFKLLQEGNYIYARWEDNSWTPLYIGQGDLGERISDHHHQISCIKSKNATHVHVHLNEIERDRIDEEKDLLAGHPEAYKPGGCNERQNG